MTKTVFADNFSGKCFNPLFIAGNLETKSKIYRTKLILLTFYILSWPGLFLKVANIIGE